MGVWVPSSRKSVNVVLGTSRLDQFDQGHQNIPSSRIVTHQNYKMPNVFNHDIALVQLSKEAAVNSECVRRAASGVMR